MSEQPRGIAGPFTFTGDPAMPQEPIQAPIPPLASAATAAYAAARTEAEQMAHNAGLGLILLVALVLAAVAFFLTAVWAWDARWALTGIIALAVAVPTGYVTRLYAAAARRTEAAKA